MEPWGTPYLICLTDDNWPSILQHCLRFSKKIQLTTYYTVVPKLFQQNAMVNGVKCFFEIEEDRLVAPLSMLRSQFVEQSM